MIQAINTYTLGKMAIYDTVKMLLMVALKCGVRNKIVIETFIKHNIGKILSIMRILISYIRQIVLLRQTVIVGIRLYN